MLSVEAISAQVREVGAQPAEHGAPALARARLQVRGEGWEGLLEVLDDRDRLAEHEAVVIDGGHAPGDRLRAEGLAAVLTLVEVEGPHLVLEPLFLEKGHEAVKTNGLSRFSPNSVSMLVNVGKAGLER